MLWLAIFVAAASSTWLATRAYLGMAKARPLIDVPGVRSLHERPMPTAGGIGIAAGLIAAFVLIGVAAGLEHQWLLALALGLLCAGLGFVDDRRGLPVSFRLIVQTGLALGFVLALALSGPVHQPELRAIAGVWAVLLLIASAACIVWLTNIFNFMDGIDGLAASQSCFVALGALVLLDFSGVASGSALYFVAVAGAGVGFLKWNWSPARLFMGDTGSLMLGSLFAAALLVTVARTEISLAVWLILWAVFIADSTLTLLHRALRRAPLHHAHREHAYQRLAQKLGAHAPVVLLYQAVNVCWLLPLALIAAWRPELTTWALVAAYFPLSCAVIVILNVCPVAVQTRSFEDP